MKKLVCYLLIVWLALMSGGANAHATKDAAHEAAHTHDHTLHVAQNQSATLESSTAADAHHADSCNQSHCGHGHTTGVLAHHSTHIKNAALTTVPTSHASWTSSPNMTDIERPKWPFTTTAVVSLLS